MQIMTAAGWRPLYDTAPHWAAKRAAIAEGERAKAEAAALPGVFCGSSDDDKTKHYAMTSASRQYQTACDNWRN